MIFKQYEELHNAIRFFEDNVINTYLRIALSK